MLGDALAIQATPGFVIKGVAIVGYPGPKALARIIDAVKRCDAVICEGAKQLGQPLHAGDVAAGRLDARTASAKVSIATIMAWALAWISVS